MGMPLSHRFSALSSGVMRRATGPEEHLEGPPDQRIVMQPPQEVYCQINYVRPPPLAPNNPPPCPGCAPWGLPAVAMVRRACSRAAASSPRRRRVLVILAAHLPAAWHYLQNREATRMRWPTAVSRLGPRLEDVQLSPEDTALHVLRPSELFLQKDGSVTATRADTHHAHSPRELVREGTQG